MNLRKDAYGEHGCGEVEAEQRDSARIQEPYCTLGAAEPLEAWQGGVDIAPAAARVGSWQRFGREIHLPCVSEEIPL